MNAGRFVIDGLAIPANRKAQRYREYPIGPAPGSVGLALLFESRWWGKAGVRSPWIGSRLRVVRAHFQNYRPWRHIERCAHRVGPRASLSSAAQSLPWPSPPPSGFANFDQSRNWNDAVYTEIRETMSLDCAQCLDSVVR